METRAFALKLKDENELFKSSSGGAFTALSDEFIINGAIVSAIYNYKTNQMEFVLYNNLEQRNKARGSKYIQSLPLNTFKEAVDWLEHNDGKLMFVGVGCQSEGFRSFVELRGYRDRVIVVDIICHGLPSPTIWKDYANRFESIEFLTFRDKRNGWHSPYSYASSFGKEKCIKDYAGIFYSTFAFRPSCYECKFKTVKKNVDITIGDFWGIEKALPDFNIEGGVSLVLTHTEKGQELFDKIKDKVVWKESEVEDCLQPMLIKSSDRPAGRDRFWNDYRNYGIDYLLKKYAPQPSCLRRCAQKIKRIMKGLLTNAR